LAGDPPGADYKVVVYTLAALVMLSLIGPSIAPYPYDENLYGPDGTLERSEPPSLEHPLGTNDVGQDVFSRVVYGAQATMITGLLGGSIIILIGSAIGITAGYVGGTVETILMRFTDFVYGVPLLPFAIVIIAFFDIGFISSILVIGALLWRGSARVLRSQVLQIRERPYILATKATGASTPRIIIRHVLPNVAPMAILFFSLGIGFSILLQAGLSFLGLANPFIPTWGVMIRNAYESGLMADAWWWSIPPGLLISLAVLSSVMLGRGYESQTGKGNTEAFAEAG